MKRTVATVGLVCALMIGCMGMPPVRAAESDTDKVTTDIGTKVMPFEELSVEVVDSMSIPSITRATSRIEWNISPDTVMKADTAYSLEADEIYRSLLEPFCGCPKWSYSERSDPFV